MKSVNVIISEHDIMYCIGGQLFSQAPNRQPRKSKIIMKKARDNFRKKAKNNNEFYYIEIDFEKEIIFRLINDILMDIPEFEELNLSQIEFEKNIKVNDPNRPKFSFKSMYDKENSESWKHDFIDLDAFIRNIYIDLTEKLKQS